MELQIHFNSKCKIQKILVTKQLKHGSFCAKSYKRTSHRFLPISSLEGTEYIILSVKRLRKKSFNHFTWWCDCYERCVCKDKMRTHPNFFLRKVTSLSSPCELSLVYCLLHITFTHSLIYKSYTNQKANVLNFLWFKPCRPLIKYFDIVDQNSIVKSFD